MWLSADPKLGGWDGVGMVISIENLMGIDSYSNNLHSQALYYSLNTKFLPL